MTFHFTESIKSLLKKFQDDLKDDPSLDIWLLYDRKSWNAISKEDIKKFNLRVFEFRSSSFMDKGYHPWKLESPFEGSTHFPLIEFLLKHKEYDNAWLVEDDIRFSGNWSVFFNSFRDRAEDLVTSHVMAYKDFHGKWGCEVDFHTTTLSIPFQKRVKAFNTIFRLTQKAASYLDKVTKEGNWGHFEITMPTFLKNAAYSILDLDDLEFCIGKDQLDANGTNRWPTSFKLNELSIPNKIYHPVKVKDKDKKVVTFLKFRLGNNLFEIAAGYSLAKKLGLDFAVAFENSQFENFFNDYKKEFGFDYQVVKLSDYRTNCTYVRESKTNKLLEFPKDNNRNIVLDGYWQSDKYFDKTLVRKLFKISDSTFNYIFSKYGDLSQCVGMHIRRTDYLKPENRRLWIIPSVEWYKHCYHKFFEGKKVVIASDDMRWAEEQFKDFENATFIDESPVMTLYAMSQCKHHILSNSTLGWWMGFLNETSDSVNIVPDHWFTAASRKNDVDIVPENWIRESTEGMRDETSTFSEQHSRRVLVVDSNEKSEESSNFVPLVRKHVPLQMLS